MPIPPLLTAIFVLAGIAAQAQDGPLTRIGRQTRAINLDTGYVKLVLKKNTSTSITGLYKSDTLTKVISRVTDPQSTEVIEYFFKNREVIFILETYKMYEANTKNVTMVFEGKYYFDKGKMIDHISLGHGRTEGDDGFDLELLRMAQQYRQELETEKKNTDHI